MWNHLMELDTYNGPANSIYLDLQARCVTPADRARLRAVAAPHAGDWLNAPPLTLWTPGAGIPVLRKLQNGAKPRYTGSAQISLHCQTRYTGFA